MYVPELWGKKAESEIVLIPVDKSSQDPLTLLT